MTDAEYTLHLERQRAAAPTGPLFDDPEEGIRPPQGGHAMTSDWMAALKQVIRTAQHSNDPSTQNAAGLFHPMWAHAVSLACNDLSRGFANCDESWSATRKYDIVEHAERRSIYQAARLGIPTTDLVMVAVWAACPDCARAIVAAGIRTLRRLDLPSHGSWAEKVAIGDEILRVGGVDVVTIEPPDFGLELRRNYKKVML